MNSQAKMVTWKKLSAAHAAGRACARRLQPALYALYTFVLAGSGSSLAADTATVSVGGTVVSKNKCNITTSASLAFGTLNAASSSNATASASLSFKCGGSSPSVWFAVTHNGGLNPTATNVKRMKHATLAEYLPYSLTITPDAGNAAKQETVTVTLQGTITPAGLRDAPAGAYADTVMVSITP